MRKDLTRVNEIHSKLFPYYEFVNRLNPRGIEPSPRFISVTKEAMKILGLPGWPRRKPLLPLSDKERKELRVVLREIGVLK